VEGSKEEVDAKGRELEDLREENKMLRELLEKCNKQIEDMQTLELQQKSDSEMTSGALVRAEREIMDLKQEMLCVRDEAAASTARAAAILAASADRPAPKVEAGVKERPQPSFPMTHQVPPGTNQARRTMVHTLPRFVLAMPLHERQSLAVSQSGPTRMPLPIEHVDPVAYGIVARGLDMGLDTPGQEEAYASDSSSHVIGEAM
jgi:hypothetical protein